jgi:ankyrin repeat protein
MKACGKGHMDTAQVLIGAKAQLNLQDKDGNTALISASRQGHTDTVQALIKAGADLNLQTQSWEIVRIPCIATCVLYIA